MDQQNKDDQGQLGAMTSAIDPIFKTLIEHPGFQWTHSGFQVLHADWPAYPSGHGVRAALAALSDFPDDIDFFPIDRIDNCTLFVVGTVKGDEFSKNHFHVALEDNDIRELARSGYISGVSVSDQRELEYDNGGVSLTYDGHHASLYFELSKDFQPGVANKIEDLVLQRHYDTAVRESALLLEVHLQELTGLAEFGQNLLNACFGAKGLLLPRRLTNRERLALRARFRQYFRYVRNEFAHNFKSLSLLTTCRLLTRCSYLYAVADACSSQIGHEVNLENSLGSGK